MSMFLNLLIVLKENYFVIRIVLQKYNRGHDYRHSNRLDFLSYLQFFTNDEIEAWGK